MLHYIVTQIRKAATRIKIKDYWVELHTLDEFMFVKTILLWQWKPVALAKCVGFKCFEKGGFRSVVTDAIYQVLFKSAILPFLTYCHLSPGVAFLQSERHSEA